MTIIKTCKKHGNLTRDKCIKAKVNKNGTQGYRCKLCMQELHKKHYQANKDKVLEYQREYRAKNAEKIKESKQKYAKKLWEENKDNPEFREKHRQRDREWRKRNASAERARDKRYSARIISELGDSYVRDKLKKGTNLKSQDIPPELIDFKRTIMLTKRLIRHKNNKVKDD